MSRITHFKQQPMNIEFWDYYILCHLNSDAALALQRMEYWDGTKDESNTHAEAMNDAAIMAGQLPTQDTSNWIYKSLDELQWELLGAAGEKRLMKVINFLVDDLKYLRRRNNPLEGWDRKKQYEFKASRLQEHINYLGYIIGSFNLPTRHLRPVFYAIEVLTSEGTDIDSLNREKVLAKIEQLKNEPKAPHFLKGDLEKMSQFFTNPPGRSFRTFAEWKAHICGMHSAESRNAKRRIAECIPHMCGSNSIEDTYETNIRDTYEENAEAPIAQSADADIHTSLSFSSEDEMVAYLKAKGMKVLFPEENTSTPPGETQSQEDLSTETDTRLSDPGCEVKEENQGKIIPIQRASAQPEKPGRQKPDPRPEKPAIVLGEREQAVYNEWAKMPWFKGIAPRLTQTLAGHCATLALCETIPKADVMLKTRHWRDQQHPDQKGRGYEMGNFVNDYPKYLSSKYQAPPDTRELAALGQQPRPRTTIVTREQLKAMPIGEEWRRP